ncbi:response regulator transcription factor [Oricola cellulosilytica]|uniref:Response regulator transcription factor n=1 Tax=Oricola cellulosilytica TaxID=1429082 RepID=A0A4R0PEA2_9HYPH|nr:response regulator transcription factor [Oricola cellulosilytica]TCD16125.1 response regulator transcription factor [Oricola cellulosilytica]
MRLLIVEDAEDVADAIAESLSRLGHACDRAGTLADARQFLAVQPFDLMVLDINLPDGSGFDLLREIRVRGETLAVIMLTARLGVDDRVDALDAGADDYLVKPFDIRELEARLRAVSRRRHGETDAVLEAGDISFNTATRQVTVRGEVCELTRREQALLEILLASRGRVIAKEELHSRLFGLEEEAGLNAIELYVARLRKKIPSASLEIRTLRGLGYQAFATRQAADG